MQMENRFHNIVNRVLESSSMDRQELADKMGVHVTTVGGWIKGNRPARENAKSLVEVLHEVDGALPTPVIKEAEAYIQSQKEKLKSHYIYRTDEEREKILEKSQKIIAIMRQHGLSMDDISELMGVAQPTIYQWANGKNAPNPENYKNLRNTYFDLFEEEEGKNELHKAIEEIASDMAGTSDNVEVSPDKTPHEPETDEEDVETAGSSSPEDEEPLLEYEKIQQENEKTSRTYQEQAVRDMLTRAARRLGCAPKDLREEIKPTLSMLDVELDLESI